VRLVGFSPKLRIATFWPALAAVATASALLWALLPGLFEESAALQLRETLQILAPLTAGEIQAARTPRDLEAWARTVAGSSALRLTLIAADGKVLADSARTAEEVLRMENHARRPEVVAARAQGEGSSVRTSATTGRTYVYAAVPLEAGGRSYFLRLAQPLDQVEALRGRLAAAMVLAALAAGAAVLLLSTWVDRRLFQPLSRLATGAAELARGDYGHRLAVPDEGELARLAVALNRLAATVEGQLAAVGHERDHLKAILSGMSEGVLVVGRDGRALLANPAFRRLFELGGEVAGKAMLEIVREPELARVVEATLQTGEPQHAEVELRTAERRCLELLAAPLPGERAEDGRDGRGEGAVVVARDTTEMIRLTEMRRDFVANVSHELKTPLAAIRGYAETLRDGALDEPATAARFTERILLQCKRLQALLADLLTLSRLESLERAPQREPVDLAALVQRAVETTGKLAEEKRVEVRVEVQEVPPVPRLAGDAEGLERLAVNLLDNAIKYNRPKGRVTVRVQAREGQVILEVVDTGIGIPQDALGRIFERFYRVDKGRSREEGGTGLGLAIVKHVAQAHGGQVDVESRLGQGSTFRVRLPLATGGGGEAAVPDLASR
jgi:two-component system phosphate regulon sensor histidine kinase PhoR